jgi:hypothetical protein
VNVFLLDLGLLGLLHGTNFLFEHGLALEDGYLLLAHVSRQGVHGAVANFLGSVGKSVVFGHLTGGERVLVARHGLGRHDN